MYKIKALNNIADVGMNLLEKDKYSIVTDEINLDAIVLRSYNMHDMVLPENLKAIARAGAGVNNIPIEKCTGKGVVVFNTPGANANGVKELLLLALLLSSRKVYDGIKWCQSLKGEGSAVEKLVEKGKSNFQGPEIKGKTLGVVGLGAIGIMVANDAQALQMDVIGFDPFLSVDSAWSLSRKVKKASSLEYVLANSDYLTVHIPLNKNTTGMFNKELINKMKDGIRIINLSRGALMVNKDIIEAVKEGKIASYVTDFPEDELLGVDGIIPIPHLGASTPESEDNCAVMAIEQLKEYLENGNIINSVNFPDCKLEQSSEFRISVLHRNIPNMVGKIADILTEKNINISNMLNCNKNEVSCSIMDVESYVDDSLIKSIEDIEGVMVVRSL